MQIANHIGATPPRRGHVARAAVRLAVVFGVHVVVLLALVQLDPEVRKRIEPVLVSLITPPQPPEPAPPPPPPPPKASPKLVTKASPPPPAPIAPELPQAPVVVESPSAITTPVAPAAPPAANAAVPAPAPLVVAPKPPAIVPPRFDVAYLNNPRPEYPRAARRMGEHGRVMLHVFVTSTGNPEKIEVRTSSGSPRLDQAAREAVERWKFVPARQGDEPVSAWVLVPITFVLEG